MKRLRKHPIALIFVTLFVAVAVALVVLAVRPSRILTLRCADGSKLTISSVTFGTNHTWSGPHWRTSGPSWLWNSQKPSMAIWGVWEGREQQTHSFRFVTVAEGGYVTSTLTNRME